MQGDRSEIGFWGNLNQRGKRKAEDRKSKPSACLWGKLRKDTGESDSRTRVVIEGRENVGGGTDKRGVGVIKLGGGVV